MNKDIMIAIGAYRGDNWKTLPTDIKRDMKQVGISSQVIPRNHRYRVRFKSDNDLHLLVLAGIFEPIPAKGTRGQESMKVFRYVKQ